MLINQQVMLLWNLLRERVKAKEAHQKIKMFSLSMKVG